MIKMIVAYDKNHGIGWNNQLPWSKMHNDLLRFKKLTIGHNIVMGRKTFDSLDKHILPDRVNFVLSRTLTKHNDSSLIITSDINWILNRAKVEDFWIIGGSKIYSLFEDYATKLYITEINAQLTADTYYFRKLNYWIETNRIKFPADTKNPFDYRFITYHKATVV